MLEWNGTLGLRLLKNAPSLALAMNCPFSKVTTPKALKGFVPVVTP